MRVKELDVTCLELTVMRSLMLCLVIWQGFINHSCEVCVVCGCYGYYLFG